MPITFRSKEGFKVTCEYDIDFEPIRKMYFPQIPASQWTRLSIGGSNGTEQERPNQHQAARRKTGA